VTPDRIALSCRPDGSWSCTQDRATQPCGDCDGCRQVQAENITAANALPQPGGLRVSQDPRGGYAVARQLARRIRRRR
jgi:hypothetical protein